MRTEMFLLASCIKFHIHLKYSLKKLPCFDKSSMFRYLTFKKKAVGLSHVLPLFKEA